MPEPSGLGPSETNAVSADPAPIRSFEQLRDTVKWLMAAGAALAAVLVAGFQVKNFASLLESSGLRQGLGIGASSIALLLAIGVVVSCAKIIGTPRLSVRDLADREAKHGGDARRIRLEPSPDPLIQALLERRTYLLDGHESIADFYAAYRRAQDACDKIDEKDRVSELGAVPEEGDERLRRLESTARRAERSVERLEDWAQFIAAQMRFTRLTRWGFTLGGIVFAASVGILTVVTQSPDTTAAIAKPSRVMVHLLVPPQELGLDRACPSRELEGIAVGGTYGHPTVVVTGPAHCGPAQISFDETEAVIVSIP